MTWVKICGNTNFEDAQLATDLGADALGFVFAESKRRVTPVQVAAITAQLPPQIERVGVVESHDPGEIDAAVREANLNAVQLHGGVDLRLLESLRSRLPEEIALIQALHWTVGADSSAQLRSKLREIAATKIVDRVLIDSRVGSAGGGTGVSFDWKAARHLFHETAEDFKVILAGGLRPENVDEAVRELTPWGVDVVSGVESSPGRKDPDKLASFLNIVKGTR